MCCYEDGEPIQNFCSDCLTKVEMCECGHIRHHHGMGNPIIDNTECPHEGCGCSSFKGVDDT